MEKLTMVEKLFLESIESQAKEIEDILKGKDDDLSDFSCNTMESDEDRITKDMRMLTDEILLSKLPVLCEYIECFKEHRKKRKL